MVRECVQVLSNNLKAASKFNKGGFKSQPIQKLAATTATVPTTPNAHGSFWFNKLMGDIS